MLSVLFSCSTVKQVGQLNMISTRNIEPKLNYEVVSRYSGGSQKELRKARSLTIQDAIDKTVRKIPGGEYLVNVKVYLVNNRYFAVEGDVWGQSTNATYRGFKAGDKVTWKIFENFKTDYKSGTIKSLKDDKTCLIEDENGQVIEKKYDDISKAE